VSRRFALLRAVGGAELAEQRTALFLTVLALAAGVALIVAVQLINRAALAELRAAENSLGGTPDLIVAGSRDGIAEALYPRLAERPEIAVASPVLELNAPAGRDGVPLDVLGLDPFRAGELDPALSAQLAGFLPELLAADALVLSARAAREYGVAAGGSLELRVGAALKALRVVGVLPEREGDTGFALMDLGSAQWLFARLGTLSRIELKLRAGFSPEVARVALAALLVPGVGVESPAARESRAGLLTRAYRANLGMLALVALLTGAFLVHATKTLAVLRRRATLGLLRALGVTRGELMRAVIGTAALEGLIGALVGVLAGVGLARLLLGHFGADLGRGLTTVGAPASPVPIGLLALCLALGVVAAMLGAWLPAHAAAHLAPVEALKPHAGLPAVAPARDRRRKVVLLALGGTASAFLPPLAGVSVFGYLAVALLLLAGLLLLPSWAGFVYAQLARGLVRPLPALALAQLRASSARAGLALATLVVSFSLAVAMAIMVTSFRDSFREWLTHVLPADLTLRVAQGNDTGGFTPEEQGALAAVPGIGRIEFRRTQSLSLDARRPPVALIARQVSGAAPALPLLATTAVAAAALPVYVSEAMVDLYGWRLGMEVRLPLAGQPVPAVVAGIWRDYARSFGAIVVPLERYRALSGDRSATEAIMWLAADADAQRVTEALRRLAPHGRADLFATPELKARSLALFDRTFAVTYLLEAVAIAIGLLGVGLSFAAVALARRAEFGVLRHLGLRQRDVLFLLLGEGALLGALGVVYGLGLGGLLSVVLLDVIDRQSFHWSLDLAIPWARLSLVALLLVACAALMALLAGRAALGEGPLRAVREDW
jgi:putative ABC transport system permease protein